MGIFEDKIKPKLTDGFGTIDPETLIKCAEEIGQKLSSDREEGLKNHQLRKFYDSVKQIERQAMSLKSNDELPDMLLAQLLFLRPHLANAERKQRNKNSIQLLRGALDPCLASDVIYKKADLTRFVKFFEAIVAYAK